MFSWKNLLISTLLARSKKIKPVSPIQRILVVSTTAMGDTLFATPALSNLRNAYPDAFIAVLTSPTGLSVLQNNPHINALYLLKEPLLIYFFSIWKKLKKEKFDVALIFHSSQRLILPLCHLSHIPQIIGTTGINKGLDHLLTHPIPQSHEHEIERRLNIAASIQVKKTIQTLSFFVHPNERRSIDKLIGKSNKKKIMLHPGSKEPFRRYGAKYFIVIANALKEKYNCEIFITGSSDELSLLKELQKELPLAKIFHSLSVRLLGALIEKMDLIVSNDTGPFHLSCALNRPTVGIYVSTDPSLCGPHRAEKAIVISRSPTCTPCIKRRCKNPFCFLQIPPQEVIDACTNLLGKYANT